MKFIHVSDTHIGCEIPVEFREIRKYDFLNAFKQVVDFAIQNKVDFIIHSGDLFDEYFKISSDIFLELIRLLKKLKENNIFLIAIKGNHDVKGQRQKIFDILTELNLVLKPEYNNPIKIKDITVYGISEPANLSGEDLREFYKKFFQTIKPDRSSYNIFLFHGISDIFDIEFPDPRVVPISYLPKNFDYYAFGHFHIGKKLFRDSKSTYALPGSLERTEISQREIKSEKGFFFITDDDIRFIPVKTRKMEILEKIVSTEEDVNEITQWILSRSKEEILKLRIKYKKDIFEMLKNKIQLLIQANFLIISDLYPEDVVDMESISKKININLMVEEIVEKLYKNEKEKILELLEIIKEGFDEIYLDRSTDIDRIKDYVKSRLFEERWFTI